MKTARSFHFLAAALAALHFTACSGVQVTHVAPGKSARAALAERNRPQQVPVDATAPGGMPVAATAPGQLPSEALPPLPSGEVKIPGGNGAGDGVADSFSRGTFAMQAGQIAEAIAALEQTVKLDPDFTDAWGKLAILYQKTGNSTKATDAFKRAKRLGDANGGTVTRDAAGGLQLQ
jgi:cytochrome c-type biogenesis protein CcmH/NrfG